MISVSFRGWGLSSPATPDVPLAYSIGALAEDIIAILGQFQAEHLVPLGTDGAGELVLCGHSMGAKVALKVAALLADVHSSRDHPSGPRLRALLLLAPAPPGPLVTPDEVRAQMLQAYDSADSVRQTVRIALAGSTVEDTSGGWRRLESDGDMDMIVQDSLAGSEGAKRGWLEVAMGEDISGLLAENQRMRESELKLRVLVARGDRVETAERVEVETVNVLRALSIPDVKFRVLEPSMTPIGEMYGHLLPLEAPQHVASELLALLDDVA